MAGTLYPEGNILYYRRAVFPYSLYQTLFELHFIALISVYYILFAKVWIIVEIRW